jgi:PleD family two-component response regulator
MMTNAANSARLPHAATATIAQKVVIVNGSPEMLDLLETVLDAGHYDVVFVESSEHAYSQIKRVQPNLAIICVSLDEADGFQVLSMLKLDEETRGIPVLTYMSEHGHDELEEENADPSDEELFPAAKTAVWMN